MTFFILIIYTLASLVRPQEWFDLLYNVRIIFYILLITIISWFFSRPKNVSSPQTILLILLLAVIMISSALNGWVGGGILVYAPEFAKAALVPFLLFSTLIDSPAKQKTIMLLMIVSALIMVSNGISQKASIEGIGWAGSKLIDNRINYLGMFNDPNDLGMFFVMTIPFSIYFFHCGNFIVKILALASIYYLLYGIYLTNSRGTLVGILVILALWFMQRYSVKTAIISSIITIPSVVLILSKFRTIDPNESSAYGRFDAWYQGFQMLRNNPFFGVGKNNFMDYHDLTAHNSFILIFAELGIAGYFLWLSFLILTFHMLFKVITSKKPFFSQHKPKQFEPRNITAMDPVDHEILLAKILFFSMTGYAVTGFFLSRSYVFILYIFSGLSVAAYYRSRSLMPEIEPVKLSNNLIRLARYALISIVGLYLITRILLHWNL